MLTDDSQVESDCLIAGNASGGMFEAAVNVARQRDGSFPMSLPVKAMPYRRRCATVAPNAPTGSCSQPRRRQRHIH